MVMNVGGMVGVARMQTVMHHAEECVTVLLSGLSTMIFCSSPAHTECSHSLVQPPRRGHE